MYFSQSYELLNTSSAEEALVEEQDLVNIQPHTLTVSVRGFFFFFLHTLFLIHVMSFRVISVYAYIKRRHEAKAGFFNKKLLL